MSIINSLPYTHIYLMNFRFSDILPILLFLTFLLLTIMQLVWGRWNALNIITAFLRLAGISLLAFSSYKFSREGASKRVANLILSGSLILVLYCTLRIFLKSFH